MTPTKFRNGGGKHRYSLCIAECSLGSILVARSERGVCAVLMGDNPLQLVRDLQDQFPKANLIGDDGDYDEIVAKVIGLIETPSVGLTCPWTFAERHFNRGSEGVAADPCWLNRELCGHRQIYRNAESGMRSRTSLRGEFAGRRHSVPSRHQK